MDSWGTPQQTSTKWEEQTEKDLSAKYDSNFKINIMFKFW